MDFTFITQTGVTVCVALLGAVIALPSAMKAFAERRYVQRSNRRAESEFALKMSKELDDPSIKRYAIELAYAGLIGDSHLTHEQRKCLLNMPEAENKIERYMQVRSLVDVCCDKRGFNWKTQRYEVKLQRQLVKVAWFASGYVLIVCAFLPSLTWVVRHSDQTMPANFIWGHIIFFLSFFYLACCSAKNAVRIVLAENLMGSVKSKSSDVLR
jgi:hypothetical protein